MHIVAALAPEHLTAHGGGPLAALCRLFGPCLIRRCRGSYAACRIPCACRQGSCTEKQPLVLKVSHMPERKCRYNMPARGGAAVRAVAAICVVLLTGPHLKLAVCAPQDTAMCLPRGSPCATDVDCCGVCAKPDICTGARSCQAVCTAALAQDDAHRSVADDTSDVHVSVSDDDDGYTDSYEEDGTDETCARAGSACGDGTDCCGGHACLDCASDADPACGVCVRLKLRARIPYRNCCRTPACEQNSACCKDKCGAPVPAGGICWRPKCKNVFKRCRGGLKCTSVRAKTTNGAKVTIGRCKAGSSPPRFKCAATPHAQRGALQT